MKRILFFAFFLSVLLLTLDLKAQRSMEQDPSLNNLVHDPDYITDPSPSLGSYRQFGNGPTDMILIAGMGFDESIFDDFMQDNEDRYTMYAVTLAGFGNTAAPEMPAEDESGYSRMAWHNIAVTDIVNLIDKEGLDRPVIAGHFLGGVQIAFELAKNHEDKISGIVLLGGEPYRYFESQTDPGRGLNPLERAIAIDRYMAPQWFKTVTKKTWDDNMYLPEQYAKNESIAKDLWDMSASAPLPVMVRYLCEFFASDITQYVAEIKTPALVLLPTFNEVILNDPDNSYVKSFFLDSWEVVKEKNPGILFKTINDSRLFMWKDQPETTAKAIQEFVKGL